MLTGQDECECRLPSLRIHKNGTLKGTSKHIFPFEGTQFGMIMSKLATNEIDSQTLPGKDNEINFRDKLSSAVCLPVKASESNNS